MTDAIQPPAADGQRLPEQLAELAGGASLTLHVVRHAETEYNVAHVMQGWSNSPITALGERQIAAAGAALAGVPFDAAFSSDLERTRLTAEGILAAHPSPPTLELREDLREWNFGGHEEVPSAQVWGRLFAQHGLEVDREMSAMRVLAERMTWSDIFDGIADLDETGRSEKAAETVVRADRALAHVIRTATAEAAPGDERVALVVSHGGFITTLLRQMTPEMTPNTILPNCSISTVRLVGGAWTLEGVGERPEAFAA
mgnify:CR=1 FL=1